MLSTFSAYDQHFRSILVQKMLHIGSCLNAALLTYLFIYLFRWRASYNNNRDLNNRKTLKQQDLEGRERLY